MFKIAFASCAKIQDTSPQPVWAEIQAERPDVLLLLGDNIYLDHNNHGNPQSLAEELAQLYRRQLAEPNFRALLDDMKARGKDVAAIYDDHDFLGNNRYGADHDDALRRAARTTFIDAFSPAMTGTEVYRVYRYGMVDLIVLDERFHRTSPVVSRNDRDAVLGAEQWAWFEETVAASNAPFLAVASSTTVHRWADESWEQYPSAFARMVNLLGGRNGALVLSGDVHQNCVYDDSGVVEIVSSGVARRGMVFGKPRRNYGLLSFDATGVRVELRSLKASGRFDFRIPIDDWQIP